MEFFKTNLDHLSNLLKFIIERLFCILLTLGFILLITYFFFSNVQIQNPESIESQQILLFGISLENLSIWFTFVGLIITAFWSMIQYNKNKAIQQQEKASEIASDFADNIIEKLSIISCVLMSNEDIRKMVHKLVHSKKLKQFTTWEVSSALEDEKCFDNYQQIISSKSIQRNYKKILKKHYNSEERKKFNSEFLLLVENTLNHLEAICINITSKAADSQFIYASLHQSFLNTVELLAIKIASNNNNNIDNYYTNIAQVYKMWNTQKHKDETKLKKTKRKIINLQNQANKEIYKLLNKKSKTV